MRQPSCTIAGLKKASLFPVTIFQRDFPVADFVQVDAGRIERAAFQIVARDPIGLEYPVAAGNEADVGVADVAPRRSSFLYDVYHRPDTAHRPPAIIASARMEVPGEIVADDCGQGGAIGSVIRSRSRRGRPSFWISSVWRRSWKGPIRGNGCTVRW